MDVQSKLMVSKLTLQQVRHNLRGMGSMLCRKNKLLLVQLQMVIRNLHYKLVGQRLLLPV